MYSTSKTTPQPTTTVLNGAHLLPKNRTHHTMDKPAFMAQDASAKPTACGECIHVLCGRLTGMRCIHMANANPEMSLVSLHAPDSTQKVAISKASWLVDFTFTLIMMDGRNMSRIMLLSGQERHFLFSTIHTDTGHIVRQAQLDAYCLSSTIPTADNPLLLPLPCHPSTHPTACPIPTSLPPPLSLIHI